MKGKLIGFNVFEGKKEGSGTWCNCYFEVPMIQGGFGRCVQHYMCRPDVLPKLDNSILDKEYIISTRNNFLSELYCISK